MEKKPRSLIQLGGHRPLPSRRGHGRGLVVFNEEGRREVEAAATRPAVDMLPLEPPPQEPAGQHGLQQGKESLPSNAATLENPHDMVAFNELHPRVLKADWQSITFT